MQLNRTSCETEKEKAHRQRKKGKSKHRKPSRGILVTIDETGNLDSDTQGPNYVIVATATSDRRKFADVTEKFGFQYEIGFTSDRNLVPQILEDVRDLIDAIYVVYLPKKFLTDDESYERAHINLLKALKSMIPQPSIEGMLIMIDSKSEITDAMARSIFKSGSTGDRISVIVVPSNFFFEMQTNDFITGAVGRKLNKDDSTYFNKLKVKEYHEKQVSKNRRGWRSSSGDHSSSRWTRGRSSSGDHSPVLSYQSACDYLNVPSEEF